VERRRVDTRKSVALECPPPRNFPLEQANITVITIARPIAAIEDIDYFAARIRDKSDVLVDAIAADRAINNTAPIRL